MALPIRRSRPSLSEMTSPSAGFPKSLSTSLEYTQSCPCKIRARGLTTMPAMRERQRSTWRLSWQYGDVRAGSRSLQPDATHHKKGSTNAVRRSNAASAKRLDTERLLWETIAAFKDQ